MSSLYEIDKAYMSALNNFTVDEETGEVFFNDDELQKLEDDFKSKADNIACYIKDLTTLNNAMKAEKASLEARYKANEAKINKLKCYLSQSLEMRDMRNLETPRNKLSFRKSTSVVISDERIVPIKYIKTVITEKVDKKAISDALKKGELIEGCYLLESNNLQIK